MILVTGASGLIGSHLCEALAEAGYDVVAVARSTNPLLESTTEKYPKRLGIVSCDIRNEHEVRALFDQFRPKTVFHFAACCQPYHNITDLVSTNVVGTANVVSNLRRIGTRELIYASSLSVYSTPPEYLPVDELHPTQPSGVYGKSKLTGEHICGCLSEVLDVTILRFASVFGVGDTARVAGLFADAVLSGKPLLVQGGGNQSSDFIYVDDAVRGTILAWQKKATGVYNIGSGKATTIKDLAQMFVDESKSESSIKVSSASNRPFKFYSAIARARGRLDYQPEQLRSGVKKYLELLNDKG